ncbi:hypothetical protein [Lacisediminihabitans sp.]|uniref:hypothetical protein n=1 Tax=Lacisediminihabitans sp. TaxID=2787631 RepID=UPI00374C9150
MEKLTIRELEGQSVELLPTRETLFWNSNLNWAAVYASNSSMAINAATMWSQANSAAMQAISVSQH